MPLTVLPEIGVSILCLNQRTGSFSQTFFSTHVECRGQEKKAGSMFYRTNL